MNTDEYEDSTQGALAHWLALPWGAEGDAKQMAMWKLIAICKAWQDYTNRFMTHVAGEG